MYHDARDRVLDTGTLQADERDDIFSHLMEHGRRCVDATCVILDDIQRARDLV